MAYGEELLAALQGTSVTPLDNTYGLAAQGLSGAIPTLVNPYGSPGANLALTGGASILTALLAGLAKNEARDTNAALLPIKREYLNPETSPERLREIETGEFAKYISPLADVQIRRKEDASIADAAAKRQLDNQIAFATNPEVQGTEIAKARRTAQIAKEIENQGNPLAGVPKSLQGDFVKETTSANVKKQSFDYIDQAFEQAKSLTGGKAALTSVLGIPTDKGNALTGLGDSLVVQIDNALGREINSDVRERLLNLTPKYYDSAETIDSKKSQLKSLLTSLSAPTPILDSLKQARSNTSLPEEAAPVAQLSIDPSSVPAGMKLQRNRLTGETRLVPQ